MGKTLFAATVYKRPYIIAHGTNRSDLHMRALATMARIGFHGNRPLLIGPVDEIEGRLGVTGRVLVEQYLRKLEGRPANPSPAEMEERRQQLLALRNRLRYPLRPTDLARALYDGENPFDPAVYRRLVVAGRARALNLRPHGSAGGRIDPDGPAVVGEATGANPDAAPGGAAPGGLAPDTTVPDPIRPLVAQVAYSLGLRGPHLLNEWVWHCVETAVVYVEDDQDALDSTWPGSHVESPDELANWLIEYPLALKCVEDAWRTCGLGRDIWDDMALGLEWMSKQVLDLVYVHLDRLCRPAW